jgi:flagellar basal-body rod protein FlgG
LRILRKLLVGGLGLVIIVACIVGTACLVKRQVYVAICDAFPVALDVPAGSAVDLDFDLPGEPSGNARVTSQSEPDDGAPTCSQIERAQQAIEEGLSDASPEEREIWLSELKDQSPDDIRQILSLHRRLSPLQMLQAGDRAPESDRVQLMSADAAPPRLLQPPGIASASRGSEDALRLLESSIKATQAAEQVILNNIANAHTVGFKRSRVLFGDESYRQVALPGQVDQEGNPTTSGIALGSGARILANQIDVSQGRLRDTQQSLDLAIRGEGYFQIKDGNRFLYARAGAFTVNSNGEIVLASKDRARLLEPAITIPQDAEKITISHDGIVAIQQPGQTYLQQIGNIQLARFINSQGLVARGENLFDQSAASGNPQISSPGQNGLGEIRQGALEESNVVVADELAELRRMQEQLKTLQQLLNELGGGGAGR